jgi:hypothetical protein
MEYQWNVVQMDRLTSDGFVVTVHYTVNAVDGEFTSSTYGTVGYTQTEGNIVAFDNVTPEIVVGWVKDSLGQSTVEEALAAQITAQKNPVQLSGLPW